MSLFRTTFFLALAALGWAENNQQQQANGNDDGMQGYNNNYLNNDQEDDDYIKYWTDYQIVAKRCVVYKNMDQIVFQVYTGNDHCTSEPIGTYITPVPYYMQGYLAEQQQKMKDMGQDDYVYPEAAQYVYCIPYETNSGYYWMQLGCADDSTQSLAVNIYQDNQCTKRSLVNGYDDSTIDVSSIQVRCNSRNNEIWIRYQSSRSIFRHISHKCFMHIASFQKMQSMCQLVQHGRRSVR